MRRILIFLVGVTCAGFAVAKTGGGLGFGGQRVAPTTEASSKFASGDGLPGDARGSRDSSPTCLSADEISNALRQFTSENASEILQAYDLLLAKSGESQRCRAEVVAALMKALDRPNLDFTADRDSYYLWRYGAELLGELKATEALDLLIPRLVLVNKMAFSTSMNHQPALKGVVKMGAAAIPKLDAALRSNPDTGVRFYSVVCIAMIGGPGAASSLREASNSESDECVRHIISVSLANFDDNGNLKDRSRWFSSLACD